LKFEEAFKLPCAHRSLNGLLYNFIDLFTQHLSLSVILNFHAFRVFDELFDVIHEIGKVSTYGLKALDNLKSPFPLPGSEAAIVVTLKPLLEELSLVRCLLHSILLF